MYLLYPCLGGYQIDALQQGSVRMPFEKSGHLVKLKGVQSGALLRHKVSLSERRWTNRRTFSLQSSSNVDREREAVATLTMPRSVGDFLMPGPAPKLALMAIKPPGQKSGCLRRKRER